MAETSLRIEVESEAAYGFAICLFIQKQNCIKNVIHKIEVYMLKHVAQ